MPLDPSIQIGAQLALTLAGLYLPGSGTAISGLAALFAAVKEYNSETHQPDNHVPTYEELSAFIAERDAKRIPPR